MNKEEKRELRRIRHDLQGKVEENHFKQFKFRATNRQLKVSSRQIVDRLLADKKRKVAGSTREELESQEFQRTRQ